MHGEEVSLYGAVVQLTGAEYPKLTELTVGRELVGKVPVPAVLGVGMVMLTRNRT